MSMMRFVIVLLNEYMNMNMLSHNSLLTY